jgi:hypothetical protein
MPEDARDHLVKRLQELERQSKQLDVELQRLRRDLLRHLGPADVSPADSAAAESAAPRPPATAPGLAAPPEAAQEALQAHAEARRKREAVDLEFWLGGRGLLLLGVAAGVLAVGFFVKEAIERGWIGPTIRVLLGAGVGIVAAIAGDQIRARGYRIYGLWLAAGGFSAIYLSLWAATLLYALLPTGVGFSLMVVVVAAAASLGLLRDSESFVALAALGGYLAPLLLQMESASTLFGLGYLGLLSGTGLWLAHRGDWRYLAAVAVVGGAVMALLSDGDPHLHGIYLLALAAGALTLARRERWIGIALLTIIVAWAVLSLGKDGWGILGLGLSLYAAGLWLVSLVATLGVDVDEPSAEPSEPSGMGVDAAAGKGERAGTARNILRLEVSGALVTVLPPWLFYLFAMVGLSDSAYAESRGVIGFGLGLVIGGVYLAQTLWGAPNLRASRRAVLAGLGYAFWLVAPCVLWSGVALARVWLLEGLALLTAGVLLKSVEPRVASLAALTLATMTYYAVAVLDRPGLDAAFVGGWALTGLGVAVGLAVWGLAVERVEDSASFELGIRPVVLLVAAVLFLGWGTVEIQRFFDTLGEADRWDLARDLSISGFWMAYAAALLAVGFWLNRSPVRWAGLAMALLAAAKVFLYDLSQLSQLYRIVSFVALAIVLLALSFRYQKLRRAAEKDDS